MNFCPIHFGQVPETSRDKQPVVRCIFPIHFPLRGENPWSVSLCLPLLSTNKTPNVSPSPHTRIYLGNWWGLGKVHNHTDGSFFKLWSETLAVQQIYYVSFTNVFCHSSRQLLIFHSFQPLFKSPALLILILNFDSSNLYSNLWHSSSSFLTCFFVHQKANKQKNKTKKRRVSSNWVSSTPDICKIIL